MELRTYLTIISRRRWVILITFVVLACLILGLAQLLPPSFSATARLHVRTPVGGSQSYVEYNIWYADRLMNTYADLATSSAIWEDLKQELGLSENPDISVGVVPSSELIKITAKSNNPELSATIANTLASIIVQHSKEMNSQTQNTANEYLNRRKLEAAKELEQSKQAYQVLVDPIATDQAHLDLLARTIDHDQQIFIMLKDNYEQNLAKDADKLLLYESEKQMAELSKKISQEQAEWEELNAQISRSLETIDEAKRQVTLNETEYTNIVTLLDQAKISEIIQENTFTLPTIDPAISPNTQTSSTRMVIYALGLLCSLAGALVAGFIVDTMDSRLFSVDQIQAITQLELLGKIPSIRQIELDAYPQHNGVYRESMRRLRLNLLRLCKLEEIKSLAFCSADPREGKSRLIACLAIDLALAGRKILLIDADLRKPNLNLQLGVPNDTGLSDYLIGKAQLASVILDSSYLNLKLIPSGPVPPNPAQLLSSELMEAALSQNYGDFDLVLVDTPALLAVSDVDELAMLVDGTVLVVDGLHAYEDKLKTAIRLLANLRVKPIGVIINRAEVSESYHYYESKNQLARWFNKMKATLENHNHN
jgi:capsular exopolysaccharide synthesis family protein